MTFLPIVVLAAIVAIWLWRAGQVRRSSARILDEALRHADTPMVAIEPRRGWLTNWLSQAGFRDPNAATNFLVLTTALVGAAAAVVFAIVRFRVVDQMVASLAGIPGGVGEALSYVAVGAPYIVFTIVALAPTLVVRAARRARIESIEQDLAPMLELLATLAEAGLGFDSAVSRVQESESVVRPLGQEFRIYQRDVLGGIPRQTSLRRLAERANVDSVSIFVSAILQSEQVGSSLSETLRIQAEELRDRRKMRALLQAQALPVKLVFPLMACFLPGIFFPTLGPVIAQLVEVTDGVLNRR